MLLCRIYIANHPDPLSVPRLTINTATSTDVEYQVERSDTATIRVITGYEVFRFGVPMIGKYVNRRTQRTATISTVVPGAWYKIIAWAFSHTNTNPNNKRSATPAVESASTREAGEVQTLQNVQLNVPYLGLGRCTHLHCDDN